MIVTKYVTYRGKRIKTTDLSNSSCYKVEVMCPICKEIRTVHYRSIASAGHTYCLKCMNKIRNTKHIDSGTVSGRLTVIKESKTGYSFCKCECGNMVEVNNYNIRTGKTRSCGCLRKENFKDSKKVKGERHGNWKGGISDFRERFMQSKKYKDWRNEVFQRDNYTCQNCGQVGYKLNAHHIYNFADNEELRLEIKNGITLCNKCHNSFHKEFGRKNNFKQLETFLTNPIHEVVT